MASKLTVYMVGTIAAVPLQKGPGNKPSGIRILMPDAPAQFSKVDEHVTIPETHPFIGIPWNAISDPKPNPLFRRMYLFPVMVDAGERFESAVDVAFYQLDPGVLKIDFDSNSPFDIGDAPLPKDNRPVKAASNGKVSYWPSSWAARMSDYSPMKAEVHPRYMNNSTLPDDVAVAEFTHGKLGVASMGFDHTFRFVNSDSGSDDRTIADVLKLTADLQGNSSVRITVNKSVLTLTGDVSLLIGSEPPDHIARTESPHPCGVPFFFHERLYRFSAQPVADDEISVPVCIKVRSRKKDPQLGHCIPPAFMAAPSTTTLKRLNPAVVGQKLSLHVGVNKFSQSFPANTTLSTPSTLDSCVRDAVAMQQFAASLGFRSLSGSNVLADGAATVDAVTAALAQYGAAIGEGGFFLLTFSGHGIGVPFYGGGWCLNTDVLLYSELKTLLAQSFKSSTRIMVISDCCNSGQITDPTKGVKELPRAFAAAFMQERIQFRNAGLMSALAAPPSGEQPTVYFVFACADDETISDGGQNALSPFTQCVLRYPHDPTPTALENDLAVCSTKHSHIDRWPSEDEAREASEPYSLPTVLHAAPAPAPMPMAAWAR